MRMQSKPPASEVRPLAAERKRVTGRLIYEDLRERIVMLELLPGAPISRSELAEHYGVSPMPIREAFQMLEQEGLLDVFPQSRTVVTRIDVENAKEAQFLRTAVELEVVRKLAAQRPAADVTESLELLRAQEQCASDATDFHRFRMLDRAFHRSLCAAAGHPGLWTLIVNRSGHLDRMRGLHLPAHGKIDQVLADHAAILAAIRRGDPAAAVDAVRAHLSGTLLAIGEIAERNPSYF